MKEVTKENFKETISKGLVMVDFYAHWCAPCKAITPLLDELSKETDTTIVNVNVDSEPELASEYGIRSIPAVYLFKNGEVVDKQIGAASKMKYAEMIKKAS